MCRAEGGNMSFLKDGWDFYKGTPPWLKFGLPVTLVVVFGVAGAMSGAEDQPESQPIATTEVVRFVPTTEATSTTRERITPSTTTSSTTTTTAPPTTTTTLPPPPSTTAPPPPPPPTTTTPPPPPPPPPPPTTLYVPPTAAFVPSVSYDNCAEAEAAGAAPVYAGDPGYGTHLDRDRDGVGCEQ